MSFNAHGMADAAGDARTEDRGATEGLGSDFFESMCPSPRFFERFHERKTDASGCRHGLIVTWFFMSGGSGSQSLHSKLSYRRCFKMTRWSKLADSCLVEQAFVTLGGAQHTL